MEKERKIKKELVCKKIIQELDGIETVQDKDNIVLIPEEIKLSFMELIHAFMKTDSKESIYCYHDTEAYSIHEILSFNEDDTVDILIRTIDIPVQEKKEEHIKEVDKMLLRYAKFIENQSLKPTKKAIH